MPDHFLCVILEYFPNRTFYKRRRKDHCFTPLNIENAHFLQNYNCKNI